MTRTSRGPSLAVVLALAVMGFLAVRRAAESPPGTDFLRYARAGTLVARGEGARIYDPVSVARSEAWREPGRLPERSFRYPPAVAVLFAPLGALRPETAWTLWKPLCTALVGLGAGMGLSLALRRRPSGGATLLAFGAGLAPVLPVFAAGVAEGQVLCAVFGLLVGAVYALDRGWDRTAGVLAAGAAAIKVAPVLVVLWFAWKRRWTAFLWGVGALAAISWLLPVAVLGPSTAHGLLRQWAAQDQPLVTEVDERPGTTATVSAVNLESQSLRGILLRNFSRTPYLRIRDQPLDPDEAGAARGIPVHGGRSWSPGLLRAVWVAAFFLLLVVAVFATAPRPGEAPSAAALRLPLEAGLVLAALPLVSPESRWMHFLLLAPACAALAAALAAARERGPSWWAAALLGGAGAVLVFLPSDGILGRAGADALLARGGAGVAGIAVFAACALTLFRERASVPEPAAAA